MKPWKTQIAGAALVAVMAIALGVEASHLPRKTSSTVPAPTAVPIGHHLCAQADAPGDNTGVTQAADGSFSACLRVGAVAAGTYQIAARRLGKGSPTLGRINPPDDWITLTPSSGPTGSAVKISGYLAGTTADQRRFDHAQLCWAACDALIGSVAIDWSGTQAGRFTAQFVAPSAPWFAGNTVAPLRPGRYAVLFPCLPEFDKPSGLCSGAALEAHFDLTGSGSTLCTGGSSCAVVQSTPREGPAGSLISVNGWAPLAGLDGNGFLAVGIEGQSRGKPGYQNAVPLIASTPFTVSASPGWAQLAPMHSVSFARTGMDPFGIDPGNPSRFAYCADGVVEMTSDAGRSWSAVSLAGVQSASASTNYPIPSSALGFSRPNCDAVSLDAKYQGTIYAVFSTVLRNSGPPPFYFVAYMSRNLGRTWQPVPVPAGSEMGLFGGFRVDGSAAQALFWKSEATMYAPDANAFIVDETVDGGLTWHVASLRCPAAGPCVGLGPQDNARCQAVGEFESIEISGDGGRTWTAPGWPNRLGACSTSELISLASGGIAALDAMSLYPLTVSNDGGTSWQAIALPPLPGGAGDLGGCCGSTLEMLPDGRLLVLGSAWYVLSAGATEWCSPSAMPAAPTSAYPGTFPMVIGDRLWWIDSTRNGTGSFRSSAHSLPISAVHC